MIGPGAGEPCLFSTACFHGTHVSGIVAADDATVVGMAPKAGVIAVRVFTNNNGNASAFFSDIVQAYEFVIDLVAEGIPVRAVNMSLGTGPMDFPCDSSFPALKDIVDVALANGIASAVSSGNGSNTTGLSAPSCLSNTLSIGCTSKSDSICAFSNSAPGLDMLSPGLSINSLTLNGQYRVASGTSMSAPHVAGAFALLYHGSAPGSIQQAQNALKLSGPSITDTRNNVTVNRFNVEQALATLPDPSTCGDGVREGPEECDGADDPLCEGRCLADCTCDRTGCFPCEECEDCPTPPRCDSCCPDAPECPGCSSCCPDCPVPPCPPFCTDSDNDGHANDNDRCPFTEEGLEVDELGCSQAEFCERIKINVRRDARVCKKADWHNDQPLANKTYDCHFDNNGTWFNRRDDECVKGDR